MTDVATVEVPAPVAVNCVKPEDLPVLPPTRMMKGERRPQHNAQAAEADVREYEVYVNEANRLLRQCAGLDKGKP